MGKLNRHTQHDGSAWLLQHYLSVLPFCLAWSLLLPTTPPPNQPPPQRKPEPSHSQPLPAFSFSLRSQPPPCQPSCPHPSKPSLPPNLLLTCGPHPNLPAPPASEPSHTNIQPTTTPSPLPPLRLPFSHQPSVCAFFLLLFVPRVSRGALAVFFFLGGGAALTH